MIRIGVTEQGVAVLAAFRAFLKGMTDYLSAGPLDAPEPGGTVP